MTLAPVPCLTLYYGSMSIMCVHLWWQLWHWFMLECWGIAPVIDRLRVSYEFLFRLCKSVFYPINSMCFYESVDGQNNPSVLDISYCKLYMYYNFTREWREIWSIALSQGKAYPRIDSPFCTTYSFISKPQCTCPKRAAVVFCIPHVRRLRVWFFLWSMNDVRHLLSDREGVK